MGRTNPPILYFRRAFVDDPKTFARYAPIAERILCLAEQTDAVTDNQLNILRQLTCGTTCSNIERPHKPGGTASAILSRYFLRSLKHLSRHDNRPVSRFMELRAIRMPESSKDEWRRRYRSKPHIKVRYAANHSRYYDAHREDLNKKRRERWKAQSSDPEIVAKRRAYQSRPDVLAKAKERMRLRNILQREKALEESRRLSKDPHVRALRARFLRSEAHRKRVKVKRAIYKECGAFLSHLDDSERPGARHDAALALGIRAREYSGASSKLISKLSDPDRDVRHAVIWSLGERREWKATGRLMEVARAADERGDIQTVADVLTALWKIGTPDSLRAVKGYLFHPNAQIKDKAAALITAKPFFLVLLTGGRR